MTSLSQNPREAEQPVTLPEEKYKLLLEAKARTVAAAEHLDQFLQKHPHHVPGETMEEKLHRLSADELAPWVMEMRQYIGECTPMLLLGEMLARIESRQRAVAEQLEAELAPTEQEAP